ncbi:hypothetical protein K466DRAFT_505889, partial [Polyporus arcularius HHB13444]
LTITHEHGIDEFDVHFCACPAPLVAVEQPIQLLSFGLFPGTWSQPQAAFTINGLRDYHLLFLQAQMSVHDYIKYLQRSTDNVASDDVPERDRELNNTMREFMFLRTTRRAGVDPVGQLKPRSVTINCPACPQPDMNMDPNWQSRPDDQSHLDMHFNTVDGNFQASLKNKNFDESDYSLSNGAAYFVEQNDFKEYKSKVRPPKKEDTTCQRFGAMGYSRFGGRVSGTVGLSCARHMFMLPCGSVDLDRGEAFCWVDYCMCSGLQRWLCLKRMSNGYDINCQYRKKFCIRIQDIQKRFPHLSTIRVKLFPWTLPAIGKFHAPAHTASCRCKYSYNYLPGVGMTDGEAAERIWAILNNLASRTKEMSPGHRHDIMNDFYSDMNVRRLHAIGDLLWRRYLRAVSHRAQAKEHLDELEESIPEQHVQDWRDEEKQWQERVFHLQEDIDFESPYELRPDNVLSDKDILLKVTRERGLNGQTVASIISVLQPPNESLTDSTIREELLDILDRSDEPEANSDLALRCQQYHTELQRWDTLRETYFTPVVEEACAIVEDAVKNNEAARFARDAALISEDERRGADGLPPPRSSKDQCASWIDVFENSVTLPSSYHSLVLEQALMRQLVNIEMDFRRPEAERVLEDIKTSIIAREVFKLQKKKAPGKGMTLRTQSAIGKVNEQIRAAANMYRRHWVSLRALGMPLEDPHLRRLLDADLEHFDVSLDRDLGKSQRAVSWLWDNFSFVDSEQDPRYQTFYNDARKVHWFRSSAQYARWKEEVDILLEEMRRTIRFFVFWERWWLARAQVKEDTGERGEAAYDRRYAWTLRVHTCANLASRQAYRYTRLFERAKETFKDVVDAVSSYDLTRARYSQLPSGLCS